MAQISGSAPVERKQSTPTGLQRNLSLIETWGFGLTGLLLWMGVAPGAHAELGAQAMWVWIPGAIVGVLVNLQIRQLGRTLTHVSGGTPNYITHLLKGYPQLTRYAAIGYFLSWIAVLPVNAIILSDLLKVNLESLGIALPDALLRVGFTVLAFIVAFSGSHALGTLHLVFLLPAVGFLLAFCFQGSHWILFSSSHLSLIPSQESSFSFQGWAKWYLNGTYAFYACETASVFVADSKRPYGTLQSLLVAAALIPIVYIGGSWVLLHLATEPGLNDDTFLNLLAAAKPFWGQSASFLVTFLVVSSSLLACATAVAICPRILYQLAQDGHLSPVFGVTSRQGVFGPGLLLTLTLSLGCLVWGNVPRIVMITGVGWLVAFIVLHWSFWQQRGQTGILFPRWSLVFCVMETVVLVVGGFAWGVQDLLMGLLLPIAVLKGDQVLHRVSWNVLKPQWWIQRYRVKPQKNLQDFIALQVFILILFICGATIISWFSSVLVTKMSSARSADLLVVLILVLSFVGVAIACWTILPQLVAVNAAREQAETLSDDLQQTLQQLQQTQTQLVQQEKMSSLGQLVAGVAHEINNPVNFIHGNLSHAQNYAQDLLNLMQLYQKHYPYPAPEIQVEAGKIDLEFLQKDFVKILNSMNVGTERIREIVLSLRNFSRTDEAELKKVDIHEGIESTLLILHHRFKATSNRAAIVLLREYGELPLIECCPGQLNQVFMNILANAIDALDEAHVIQADRDGQEHPGRITIRTSVLDRQWVEIAIEDNGFGIPESIQSRIFDPFFTTKPIGKGTGMGMSISYQIITKKHSGKLNCFSTPGKGTEFVIQIPIARSRVGIAESIDEAKILPSP